MTIRIEGRFLSRQISRLDSNDGDDFDPDAREINKYILFIFSFYIHKTFNFICSNHEFKLTLSNFKIFEVGNDINIILSDSAI